eukprot:scaffold13744_cov88-Skeletonema_dohrnii-CCMP3373.AAC.1
MNDAQDIHVSWLPNMSFTMISNAVDTIEQRWKHNTTNETWLHLRPSPLYEGTILILIRATTKHNTVILSKEQLYNTIAYKRRRRCDVSSGLHGVLIFLLPSTIVMLFTAVHKEAAAWLW